MKLHGTPCEIGRETECLGDNILAAMTTGRVEDLGKPLRDHTLDQRPGQIALWYECQMEHCQDVRLNGTFISSPCSFAIRETIRDPNTYELPGFMTDLIVTGVNGSIVTEPICANRRYEFNECS